MKLYCDYSVTLFGVPSSWHPRARRARRFTVRVQADDFTQAEQAAMAGQDNSKAFVIAIKRVPLLTVEERAQYI